MPRNMSFAMSVNQVGNQTKTVTRRFGWLFLKPGDLVQPVEKAMGLKKGQQARKIGGLIRIVSIQTEPLCMITKSDCIAEGFPDFTPDDFVAMIQKANPRASISTPVNRIEFEYMEAP